MQILCNIFMGLWAVLFTLLGTSCERDGQATRPPPPAAEQVAAVRESALQPGVPLREVEIRNPYEGDPHAIAEGKRLYNWYNCSGCHFGGGGGMGPPLMDEDWIYGDHPANIFESIVKGRPNGMPSYEGRVPQDQLWMIVAYVQSLSKGAEEAEEHGYGAEGLGGPGEPGGGE